MRENANRDDANRDDFDLERRSQLVGVINIGSTSPASLLSRLERDSEAMDRIRGLCQFYLNQLWPVFARPAPPHQPPEPQMIDNTAKKDVGYESEAPTV